MNRWIFTLPFLFSFFTIFSQTPNLAEYRFSAKENLSTRASEGILFDSGGDASDYQSFEKSTFTICPEIPHQTIHLDVEHFNLERGVDFLKIYDAAEVGEKPYSVVTGYGENRSYIMPGGCITLQFESDEYLSGTGFRLKWRTGDDIEMMPPPSDCSNPTVISSLPFNGNNLSTCGAGNDYWVTPCNSHLWAEDMIFVYDSPGDECVEILLNQADDLTSISIYDDCPDRATECMAEATIGFLSTPSTRIPRVFFEEPGRYYFMVSQPLGCSDFNLEVIPIDCPIVLPGASLCEQALPITGCNNIDVPSIITVQQGQGDETFLRDGVNDGCWGGFDRANFTWFKMTAQADGDFAFLLSSEFSGETSDIDIQVWGPILNPSQECNYVKNNEPIRSTFADEKISYDLTGLTARNPDNNRVVNDDCENEFGDGFVRPIQVKEGETYYILVNDYDGIINSGAVSIDFSETTPAVLAAPDEIFTVTPDTVLCAGAQLQLEAEGGLVYRWLSSPDLSCLNCPNPIATPSGNSTYRVIVGGVCRVDTLSVNIVLPEIDITDDFAVCAGDDPQISVSSSGSNVTFIWTDPNGYLSCDDCANPTANLPDAPGFYTFEVEADFGNCKTVESITLEVTAFPAPQNFIIENAEICEGEAINLGNTSQSGIIYTWLDENGNTISAEADPAVSPTSSQWYFVDLEAVGCSISDSVLVEVFAPATNQNIVPQTICPGVAVFLNPDGDPDLNYTWTDGDGNILSSEPNPELTFDETTIFSIGIESSTACPELIQTLEITVHPKAELTVENTELSICTSEEAILFAESNIAGGTFEWSTGDTTNSVVVTPSESTVYQVFYTDPNDCETLTEEINVRVGNAVSIDSVSYLPELETIFENCELTFMPFVSPNDLSGLDFEWKMNDELVGTDENLTYLFETAGIYELELSVSQNGGCIQFYTQNLTVKKSGDVVIPNIFSPNGDGINDYFIPFAEGKQIRILDMMVFNRWGGLVYHNDNNDLGWDGTLTEERQTSDVYVYKIMIELPSGEKITREGDVTLYR